MATKVEQVPGRTPPVPLSKQMLTSITTAVALSAPASASWVLLQSLSANVRWWDDGSVPTVSQGFQLVAGTYFEYTGDLQSLLVIGESGAAILNVGYYTNNPPGS